VGDVGADVVTAETAEPERTGVSGCFHVGGLGADPVRHRHLADHVAVVLGARQQLAVEDDPVAVELVPNAGRAGRGADLGKERLSSPELARKRPTGAGEDGAG
jgi:hypothetical protein